MKQQSLYALWAVLFLVCAALGFIPDPEGPLRFVLTGVSLLFFLPPALLLRISGNEQDANTAKLIRNLSALSLCLTSVLLILNFLMAFSSEWVGRSLHYILIIVGSPMICSGHWAMSLFLWACLLMASVRQLKQ